MRLSPPVALAAALGCAAILSGCGSGGSSAGAATDVAESSKTAASGPAGAAAVANIEDGQGKAVGSATAMRMDGSIMLSLRVEGLVPGRHGVHVHTVGRCDDAGFASAGGHWNPGAKQHGLDNPKGQHAGDLPNLEVGADGRGMLRYQLKGGSLDELLDADGAAMIVHLDADDQKSDPSGNSGDRIACGVFTRA